MPGEPGKLEKFPPGRLLDGGERRASEDGVKKIASGIRSIGLSAVVESLSLVVSHRVRHQRKLPLSAAKAPDSLHVPKTALRQTHPL
jgi:hypothetical protein